MPDTETALGTAAELRQRRAKRMSESLNRATSSPPAVAVEETLDIPGASAPPLVSPDGAGTSQNEIHWTAERLHDFDEHVHVTLRRNYSKWNGAWAISTTGCRICVATQFLLTSRM